MTGSVFFMIIYRVSCLDLFAVHEVGEMNMLTYDTNSFNTLRAICTVYGSKIICAR